MTVVLQAALQRLLVLAAAVALLGHGGLELGPRLLAATSATAASTGSVAPARPAVTRPAAESQPVQPPATLRTALALVAPSGGADPVAGPGVAPPVAPHLAARPVVRPPTRSYALQVGGGASGRAPPAAAGT